MLEKIDNALMLYGSFLPKAIKQIIRELGQEIDQLKAEMKEVRSQLKSEKEK